jgi:hypothetical protein
MNKRAILYTILQMLDKRLRSLDATVIPRHAGNIRTPAPQHHVYGGHIALICEVSAMSCTVCISAPRQSVVCTALAATVRLPRCLNCTVHRDMSCVSEGRC